MTAPTLADVLALAESVSNWGRWGADDQLGTLNHVTTRQVRAAAEEIRTGQRLSLALRLDGTGPQTGRLGRFNPVHLMLRDGGDAVSGATAEHVYHGVDKHLYGTDDLLLLPTQSSTHWDGLSHVLHGDRMYNGFRADDVSSFGAARNGIEHAAARMVGRGVLLDVAAAEGRDALDRGEAITADMLDGCAARQNVPVHTGDFLLVRTGHLARMRARGWGDYAGGDAPGLGLDAVHWLHAHQVAAAASDTWGFEVLPNEVADVAQPVHLVAVAYLGLWIGEMFDLDELARQCAAAGTFSFFFSANTMPVVGGVASPTNPIAIL